MAELTLMGSYIVFSVRIVYVDFTWLPEQSLFVFLTLNITFVLTQHDVLWFDYRFPFFLNISKLLDSFLVHLAHLSNRISRRRLASMLSTSETLPVLVLVTQCECVYHVHEPFEEDQVQFQVTLQLRFSQIVIQYISPTALVSSPSQARCQVFSGCGSDQYSRGLIGVSFQREHIGLSLEVTVG